MRIRIQGAIGLLIGALIEFAYLGYLINEANAGVQELLVRKIFIFIPLAVMGVGLFMLVFGESSKKHLEIDDNNLSLINVLILITPLILGAVVYYYFSNYLESLGYVL